MNNIYQSKPLLPIWIRWTFEAFCILVFVNFKSLLHTLSSGKQAELLDSWTSNLGTPFFGLQIYLWGMLLCLLLTNYFPIDCQKGNDFARTYRVIGLLPVLFIYSIVQFISYSLGPIKGSFNLSLPSQVTAYLWIPCLVALFSCHKYLKREWPKAKEDRKKWIH